MSKIITEKANISNPFRLQNHIPESLDAFAIRPRQLRIRHHPSRLLHIPHELNDRPAPVANHPLLRRIHPQVHVRRDSEREHRQNGLARLHRPVNNRVLRHALDTQHGQVGAEQTDLDKRDRQGRERHSQWQWLEDRLE